MKKTGRKQRGDFTQSNGDDENHPSLIKKAEHGKHPNSLANLKLYKKGESSNPGGRTTKYQKLGEALVTRRADIRIQTLRANLIAIEYFLQHLFQ